MKYELPQREDILPAVHLSSNPSKYNDPPLSMNSHRIKTILLEKMNNEPVHFMQTTNVKEDLREIIRKYTP